jgi:hypothetical protein
MTEEVTDSRVEDRRKGGKTRQVGTVTDYRPAAAAYDTVETAAPVAERTAVIAPRDSVRWGPIVAGLVTALSLFLLLSLVALGVGLAAAGSNTAANQPSSVGTAGTIVAAVIGLLAFVIGGFVAGRSAAVGGRGAGALNGFLVWALGVTAILLLGAMGIGALFGAAGQIFGQIQSSNVNPSQVQVNPTQAADAVRNSALVAAVSLALPALAAALGGAIGARRKEEVVETIR